MKLMPIKMLNSKMSPRTVVLENEMTNKQADVYPPHPVLTRERVQQWRPRQIRCQWGIL